MKVQEALQSAIDAMEYHTEQTRPIQKTIDTLALCKAALVEIEKCEPVAEAIRERDRLGFAVVNVIGKLDEIIESMQEVEIDDFLHIAVPIDMWNELQDALEDMPKRADLYTSPQPRELYAGDCVAYLYKDNNGGLKICNESPPPDKSFPVFITNLSFLDVARTVLDDCSDLIIKHGGVNLWKELVAKINRDYKQLNTKG